MEINVVKEEKQDVELTIDNITVAEVMRVYLEKAGVDFVAWRREHPSKPVIMQIKNSDGSISKAVSGAVSAIKKDCDKLAAALKK